MGFPQRLPMFFGFAPAVPGRFGAQGGHGLADGREKLQPVAALFDHMIPPRLAVAVARGPAEPVQRIVHVGEDGRFVAGLGMVRQDVFLGSGLWRVLRRLYAFLYAGPGCGWG